MSIQKSAAMTLSTNEQRRQMAASADTLQKTPDYHLPWTGPVVEGAIRKAMDLNPAEMGGVLILPSSFESPADLDIVQDAGLYTAKYAKATGYPSELQNVTPISLTVSTKAGVVYQEITGMGDKFTRFSTEVGPDGVTWSVWSPKPTNAGGIGTEDPDVPAPDPIEDINGRIDEVVGRIDNLETVTSGGAGFGTAELAQQMLDKTYDYDAVKAAEV